MRDFYSFADEYVNTLEKLVHVPDFICTPRGLKCHELVAAELCVDPLRCFFMNEKRDFKKLVRYLIGETLWYFGGRNDLGFIEKYATFWRRIANDDGSCNSAYGNLLFAMKDAHSLNYREGRSQWEWAYDSLKADKDTRQAIMHFNRPQHQALIVKDFPCTCYVNFLIREDALYLISRMRSQDVVKGLTFDMPFFSLLHQNMFLLLSRGVYPELQRGGVIHTSDSLHYYDTDLPLITEMLKHKFDCVDIHLPLPLVDEHGRPTEFYDKIFMQAETAHETADAAMYAFKMLGGQT